MKNAELIQKLKQFPLDMEICVMDIERALHEDGEDESSEGIYSYFEVFQMHKDNLPENSLPWVAISFSNPFVQQEIDALEMVKELK